MTVGAAQIIHQVGSVFQTDVPLGINHLRRTFKSHDMCGTQVPASSIVRPLMTLLAYNLN